MRSIPEQFSSANKMYFEVQLATMTALTNKAMESIEKIIDLNMHALKASLEESMAILKQILSAKNSQELFSLSVAQGRPTAEKAQAYGRHLVDIATSTQAEFSKVAEAQIADTSRTVTNLVEKTVETAPDVSANAVAIMKSAIDHANTSYEQLSKAEDSLNDS